MKYSEAKQGRVFVIRLEDGDIVHEVVEAFAQAHAIKAATLIAVGGADDGSRLSEEVIITKLLDCTARRLVEPETGLAIICGTPI